MRAILGIALVVASAGCGSASHSAPDASAADASSADAVADAAADAVAILPYPAGPYGAAVGETMPNFIVEGYPLSRTQRDYTQVPFRDISLAEVRSDPSCTCMVVLWTASNCPYGMMEDTTFSSALADDPGLCAMEVVAYNLESAVGGTVATFPTPSRADLDEWVSAERQSYPVGLGTQSALAALAAGSLPLFPVTFAVRTSDMRVAGIIDGVGSNVAAQARALCDAPRPSVETVSTGLAPAALRIDDGYAYVRDDAIGLFRVPLSGGSKQTLVDASVGPGAFDLDATNVYFAASSGGTSSLNQLPKTGGAPLVLESAASDYASVVVDSAFVYAARSDGAIERIPIGGGSATTLLSGEQHPGSLALDDQAVYFIAQDTMEIASVPKGGGQRTSVLPPGLGNPPIGIFVPTNLVMGEGALFVSGPVEDTFSSLQMPGASAGATFELMPGQAPLPLLGGPSPSIAMSPSGLVTAFSCTSTSPCVDYPRGAIGASTPTDRWVTVTTGEPFTNAIAADASYVYWTTAETSPGKRDGALRRIKR